LFEAGEGGEDRPAVDVVGGEVRAGGGAVHRATGVGVAGDDDELDGQAEGVGLVLDEGAADAVHGDAVVRLADAGDEPDDVEVGVAPAGVVEGQGTVLAPAPEEGGSSGCGHG
jgi:hypothetical protein